MNQTFIRQEIQMQTKLTVRVNQDLIQAAKRYARARGVSLSQLIEAYLNTLAVEQNEPQTQTPILQRLTGILPPEVSLEDIHQHWQEKYG
jgi:hypothetical protein